MYCRQGLPMKCYGAESRQMEAGKAKIAKK